MYRYMTDDSIQIRKARESDAEQLLTLMNELMKHGSAYLVDHLDYSSQQEAEYIRTTGKDTIILVAEKDGLIIGWLTLLRNYTQFRQHSGTIVMGIKQEFQNRGIGAGLLQYIQPIALFMKIERLELSVRTENIQTYNFFVRHGFFEEGRRVKAIKQKDIYGDEIIMAKLLR